MTIDSTWLCAFKQEVPEAFTKKASFYANAAFIGNFCLMCA